MFFLLGPPLHCSLCFCFCLFGNVGTSKVKMEDVTLSKKHASEKPVTNPPSRQLKQLKFRIEHLHPWTTFFFGGKGGSISFWWSEPFQEDWMIFEAFRSMYIIFTYILYVSFIIHILFFKKYKNIYIVYIYIYVFFYIKDTGVMILSWAFCKITPLIWELRLWSICQIRMIWSSKDATYLHDLMSPRARNKAQVHSMYGISTYMNGQFLW